MSRDQAEIFAHATAIAERKIRQARAMQAESARTIVREVFKAVAGRMRRRGTTVSQKAKV